MRRRRPRWVTVSEIRIHASWGKGAEGDLQLKVAVNQVIEALEEDHVDPKSDEDARCRWRHPVDVVGEAGPTEPVMSPGSVGSRLLSLVGQQQDLPEQSTCKDRSSDNCWRQSPFRYRYPIVPYQFLHICIVVEEDIQAPE